MIPTPDRTCRIRITQPTPKTKSQCGNGARLKGWPQGSAGGLAGFGIGLGSGRPGHSLVESIEHLARSAFEHDAIRPPAAEKHAAVRHIEREEIRPAEKV